MFTDTDFASQIREKLGSESTGKWLEIMDFMISELPFLRSAGRPTISEISNSRVGRAGFDSFRLFVEEKQKLGGLGWSFNTYKSWKKAHTLVEKYPYLRDLEISASEINTLERENSEFPSTLDAYFSLKKDRKTLLEERQKTKNTSLQKQIDSITTQLDQTQAHLAIERASADSLKSVEGQLRKELTEANQKLGSLTEQLESSANLATQRNQTIETLKNTVSEKKTELEKLKKKLDTAETEVEMQKIRIKKHEKMSLFERIIFCFQSGGKQ